MSSPNSPRRVRLGRTAASLAGLALLATPLLAPAGASAQAPVRSDEDALLTPISATIQSPPSPVLGADGRMHLAYELELSNTTPLDVTLVRVGARSGARAIGATLSGRTLAGMLNQFGGEPGATIRAGRGGILFMDVAYSPRARTPRALSHTFSVTAVPAGRGGARAQRFVFSGVPTKVGQARAVSVAPPLRGANWLVGNGCCSPINAHRGATLPIDGTIRTPERFAIDFVQLDAENRLFRGPLEALGSYAFFGEPILSVAPGRVVHTRDTLPEQVPGRLPAGATIQTAGGNEVVVDIGGGRWAFYAHLQPGSVRVRAGQRIRTGDVLGLLGNTGNTDAPHLHFHIMDSPSPLQSNGVPFTFPSFRGQGVVTSEATLFRGEPAPIDPNALAGPHANAMPINDQLIDFGN